MDLIIHIPEEDFKHLAYADHFKLRSYIESGEVVEENALEQEPCTDAISRQAVLDAIEKAQYSCDFCKEHHIDYSISMEMVRIILHDLPPVAPKQSFESMTNGEVIQALFPKIKVKQLVGVKGLLHVFFDKKEDNAFDENWWNAPYKGGAE